MEVQAVHAVEMFGAKLRHRKAQPRTGAAGVVARDLALAVLGIQPKADVEDLSAAARLGESADVIDGRNRSLGAKVRMYEKRVPRRPQADIETSRD